MKLIQCVWLKGLALGLSIMGFGKQPPPQLTMDELLERGTYYFFSNSDSSLYYLNEYLNEARRLGDLQKMAFGLTYTGECKRLLGRFPEGINDHLEALELYKKLNISEGVAHSLTMLGMLYYELNAMDSAFSLLKEANALVSNIEEPEYVNKRYLLSGIGAVYTHKAEYDSAFFYQFKALHDPNISNDKTPVKTLVLRRLGTIEYLQQNYLKALEYYKEAENFRRMRGYDFFLDLPNLLLGKARVFYSMELLDSAFHYGLDAYHISAERNRWQSVMESAVFLSEVYSSQQLYDSAYYFMLKYNEAKDRIYGVDRMNELILILLSQQEKEQEHLRQEESIRYRFRLLLLVLVLIALGFFAVILLRNNYLRQKANSKLKYAYQQLRSTQSQLIQQEKLASLGQLTAGIAHEIQNPLNFVNNFSEVSIELVDEMHEELSAGSWQSALEIANDIKQNMEKINHHGHRASSIVKGMLEHSRTSSGQKEPTDINALCDEYLRLSYHGLRAKDKNFNADYKTNFDPNLPKVNVVPQDIGRVLLNIINNAFQACNEGSKTAAPEYLPFVSMSTKFSASLGLCVISISDNGPGIPEAIKDKIFQPFFTTKPAGQGTGLGLSLAYDIVTKGHGGELKLDSKEGEGTRFVIQLPLTS